MRSGSSFLQIPAFATVLSVLFACHPMVGNAPKPPIYAYVVRDHRLLLYSPGTEESHVLAALQPDIDDLLTIEAIGSCVYVMAPSIGIAAHCPEYDARRLIPVAENGKASGATLPQRLWRSERPVIRTIKQGIRLRKGLDGKVYFVTPYTLSAGRIKSNPVRPYIQIVPPWKKIRTGRGFFESNTDVLEIRADNASYLLRASPYNGLRRARLRAALDNGKDAWKAAGRGLPKQEYIRGLFFSEPIESIAYCKGKVYAAVGFGRGLWASNDAGRSFHRVYIKGVPDVARIDHLHCGGDGQTLYVSGRDLAFRLGPRRYQSYLSMDASGRRSDTENPDVEWIGKIRKNAGPAQVYVFRPRDSLFFRIRPLIPYRPEPVTNSVRGIFLPAQKATRRRLMTMLPRYRKAGLNAVVIDFKDDYGRLVYGTKLAPARDIRSRRDIFDAGSTIALLHKNGIKVIARIVVFKDKRLFFYQSGKYTLRNIHTGKPWQYGREYWVDPFSEFVWNYNLAVAQEAESLGVDEIQFDYIRFPSDGPTLSIRAVYRPDADSLKVETLRDFLCKARRKLRIPVGIDMYGFNAWYRLGAVIGQDIGELAHCVDVISPMFYPSHFGNRWFMRGPRRLRSYRILRTGTSRAIEMAGHKVTIRPFLQGFSYKSPTYGMGYILNQIHGVYRAGSRSYLFWNMGGKYRLELRAFRLYDASGYKPH